MSALPIKPRPAVDHIERIYASTLRLYPSEFSEAYASAMRRALVMPSAIKHSPVAN